MNRLLSILVGLAWSLWLGGLITLFLAVVTLFRTFPENKPLAGTAAAGVFQVFERYQLGLAAAGLLFTFLWRLTSGAAGLKTALFSLLALCTLAAVVETRVVASEMRGLRLQGLETSARFKELHKQSMWIYTGEAAVLTVAGFLFPLVVRRDGPVVKVSEGEANATNATSAA